MRVRMRRALAVLGAGLVVATAATLPAVLAPEGIGGFTGDVAGVSLDDALRIWEECPLVPSYLEGT